MNRITLTKLFWQMNFGVGSPLLTHSLIISLIPLPQLSKYFLIYSTFAIRGLDGQEAYSEFKLSMSISEGKVPVFSISTLLSKTAMPTDPPGEEYCLWQKALMQHSRNALMGICKSSDRSSVPILPASDRCLKKKDIAASTSWNILPDNLWLSMNSFLSMPLNLAIRKVH